MKDTTPQQPAPGGAETGFPHASRRPAASDDGAPNGELVPGVGQVASKQQWKMWDEVKISEAAYLEDRGVDPDLAAAAGLLSVDGVQAARLLGRVGELPVGGLAIPYPSIDPPYFRIRLLGNGDGPRFMVPGGREVPIYIPEPVVCAEIYGAGPILVTESPTKALTMIGAGHAAVGLGGVSTTLERGKNRLNDSWMDLPLEGREVTILFDANRSYNPEVAAAEARLVMALEHAGASVQVAALPPDDSGDGWGPDDYLGAKGPEALSVVVAAAKPGNPLQRINCSPDADAHELLDDLPFMLSLILGRNGMRERARQLLKRKGISLRAFDSAVREVKASRKRAARSRKYGDDGDDGDGCFRDRGAPSQTELLLEATADHRLFHDSQCAAFAELVVDGHREVHRVQGRSYRQRLGLLCYQELGAAPRRDTLSQVIAQIQAKAMYKGPLEVVYQRVAPDGVGGIFIDLGRPDWGVLHVTRDAVRAVAESPVMFCRPPTMGELPTPRPGGSLDELRRLANLDDDSQWALVKAWLTMALYPAGPYPLLALSGEQGAAKSTATRMLRRLVDPASPEQRQLPSSVEDLMIAAENNHVLAFENVSHINAKLSDALCCLSTGSGFATRELYTNREEAVFVAQCPIILNGISDFVSRDDLSDRTVQVTLADIAPGRRRDEKELWAEFEAARPALFGALLDRVVGMLRRLPTTNIERLPRMADFARVGVAAENGAEEPALFLNAYFGQRALAQEQALESSAIGPPLREIVAHESRWTGTATELLEQLERYRTGAARRMKGPTSGRGLTSELRRLAPALRAAGIQYSPPQRQGHGGKRILSLTKVEKTSSPSSPSSPMASAGNQSEVSK